MNPLLRLCLLLVAVALAGCGSRGQLMSGNTKPSLQIKDFDQVVVMDFHANDMRPPADAMEKAEREKNINAGRILFADTLADRIAETKAFGKVSRTPLSGKFLVVTGSVDVWEPGNVATRAVTGYFGQSQFASTIQVRDGQTNEELARMNGDRNSWPLPVGASTTIIQTVTFFMNEAASHMASELAAAKNPSP